MRKLIGIEFWKMRHYPATWLVGLISVGQGVFYALSDRYASSIARYPQVEYIAYIYASARWFCMAAVFLTAYVIAGNFSMRTVLNVLSTGIDKRKYYFSRLFALMLHFLGLYICGNAAYVAVRILYTGKLNTALPLREFLILLPVMTLQVMAYAAIANMISICCKRQAASILIGEIWIFLSLLLRIYSIGEKYYTDPSSQRTLRGPITYEPMYVLECVDLYLARLNSFLCFDFLKYALSATAIIAVTSAVGYLCLARSDVPLS